MASSSTDNSESNPCNSFTLSATSRIMLEDSRIAESNSLASFSALSAAASAFSAASLALSTLSSISSDAGVSVVSSNSSTSGAVSSPCDSSVAFTLIRFPYFVCVELSNARSYH